MPAHDFMFSLAVSDESRPADADAIVGDLARAILGYLGYDAAVIADLVAQMRGALAAGAAGASTRTVAFHSQDGRMEIAISGVAAWRTARPLP